MTEVTFTKNSDDTSLLTVNLGVTSSKSMKVVSKNPEDWVENIITSRCQPKCDSLWRDHVKECLKENVTPKASKALLFLEYEPSSELNFQPRGSYTENDDGSSIIEIIVDPILTKCIEYIFSNPSQEIKNLICRRIEIQNEEIIDEIISKNLHVGKTMDEIIMSYQREEVTVEFHDDE